MIALADAGRLVAEIFARNVFGRVGATSDALTGKEMAAIFTEVTGEEHGFYAPSPDEYRGYGFPCCKDLGNMFEW